MVVHVADDDVINSEHPYFRSAACGTWMPPISSPHNPSPGIQQVSVSSPGEWCKVLLWASLIVCLSTDISETTQPIFCACSCGCGSVLILRHCNTLRILNDSIKGPFKLCTDTGICKRGRQSWYKIWIHLWMRCHANVSTYDDRFNMGPPTPLPRISPVVTGYQSTCHTVISSHVNSSPVNSSHLCLVTQSKDGINSDGQYILQSEFQTLLTIYEKLDTDV